MSVTDASVIKDFYDPRAGEDPNDTLEQWLGREIESKIAPVLADLREGVMPVGSSRRTAARFVACQMVRGGSFRLLQERLHAHLGPLVLGNMVASRAAREDPALTDQQLRELASRAAEHSPAQLTKLEPASALRTMLREADRLAALIEGLHWALLAAAEPVLLTSDSPVVPFRPAGPMPTGPQTLPNDVELHLPLSPTRLLVLGPFASTGPAVVTPDLARIVNEGLARTCHRMVFHHPATPWPDGLVLAPKPPPLPRPKVTYGRSHGSGTAPKWPVLQDPAIAQALENLGGNPDLGDPSQP